MNHIYLIIDFSEQADITDIVDFIDQIADFTGLTKHLKFDDQRKHGLWHKSHDKTDILATSQRKRSELYLSFSAFSQAESSLIDKEQEEIYVEQIQDLRNRLFGCIPEIDHLMTQNATLNQILSEYDRDKFLLFAENVWMLDQTNPYFQWLNRLVQANSYDMYAHCVSIVQYCQAENDYAIPFNSLHESVLLNINIDFIQMKITVRILPVFGQSEDDLLEFIAKKVSLIMQKYSNATAYMDSNKYDSIAVTPHERFFNIKDMDYSHSSQSPQSIRGYTRYCWLNIKQYELLVQTNRTTIDRSWAEIMSKDHIFIRLNNKQTQDYAALKDFFKPLLSRGTNEVVDSTVFSHPLMLHTVFDNNEWRIIDKSFSYKESLKGESLYNRMQIMKAHEMEKKLRKAGLIGDFSDIGRCIIRSNRDQH